MHEACLPWWYNETIGFDACPYGTRLPGDVTLPNDAFVIEWAAVVYSYIPYAVVAGVILEFLYTRGTRQFSILLFTGVITLVNELVVKRLILQPRPGALGPAPGAMRDHYGEPIGTCNITCGMPSSHSTMAIGFLMLTLYDGIIRVVPSVTSLSQEKMQRRPSVLSMISFTPLSPKQVMYHVEFVGFFSTWMALMCPVPLMRVRLADHTATQVIIGSLLGAIYAGIWFQLSMYLVNRHKARLGDTVFGCLIHNYGPIAFQVEARPHDMEDSEEWKVLQWDAKIVPAPMERMRNAEDSEDSEAFGPC